MFFIKKNKTKKQNNKKIWSAKIVGLRLWNKKIKKLKKKKTKEPKKTKKKQQRQKNKQKCKYRKCATWVQNININNSTKKYTLRVLHKQ